MGMETAREVVKTMSAMRGAIPILFRFSFWFRFERKDFGFGGFHLEVAVVVARSGVDSSEAIRRCFDLTRRWCVFWLLWWI